MNRAAAVLLTGLLSAPVVSPRAGAETNPRPEIGKPAPKLRLFTFDGSQKIKLSDLAYPRRERSWAKKRPVLVDFFRTDCEPCLRAMPELVDIHARYENQGLYVLLVAMLEETQGKEKLKKYLEDNKLPFTVLIDPSDFYAKKYLGKTVSLPATFLIDRQGVLRAAKFDAKGSLLEHFREPLESVIAEHRRAGAVK